MQVAKELFNQGKHKDFNLDENSYIIDVGSNDGIGLKPFLDLGFKNIQGIEPAKNLAELANKNGINTFKFISDFFWSFDIIFT